MQALITFCLARRAARISFADFASPKLSAAVLFDPIIVAAALRSCVLARKKVDRSYNVNTTDATSRATAEVAMTILWTFSLIDKSRYERILSTLRMPFVMHDLAYCEQLRTEFQTGSISSVDIDRESHMVFLSGELNSSAQRSKPI